MPSFSISSFSPPTTCQPRFTLVSDGYPLRRLLTGLKAKGFQFVEVIEFVVVFHDEPPNTLTISRIEPVKKPLVPQWDMQWEYLLLRANYTTLHKDPGLQMEGGIATVSVAGLPAALNALGDENWEAVGMAGEGIQGAIKHVLFKRPHGQLIEDPG